MVEELQSNHINWILVENVATDGREELRFRKQNPLMWDYIERNFEVFPETLREDFITLRRKGPSVATVPG